jgi:hypothetical protein
MRARTIISIVLCAACLLAAGAVSHSAVPTHGGHLQQRIAVLIFTEPSAGRLPDDANWILVREIRAFETFVWRYSGRKVQVEAVPIRVGRLLRPDEILDRGPFWGFLPGPATVSTLEDSGWSRSQFDGVVVLYEPPARLKPGVAGATYGPAGFSVIPLTPLTFTESGRRYPLHLVLAHEYLHQLEVAFTESTGVSYLASPDDHDLRRVLQVNSEGSAIDWRLISPTIGSWVPSDSAP